MTVRWLGAALICGLISACGGPLTTQPTAAEGVSSTPLPEAPAPTVTEAPTPTAASPEELIAAAPVTSALATLGTLEVKGRAPQTGYDRDLFGQRWADTDRNGCDTRNDVLGRDLTAVTFKPGTRDCVVIAGNLADPYTGTSLTFVKADAGAIQIDHVVALSDAWQKGAQQWEPGKRLAFANDPLNLLAVDGPSNASKSDGDAATWLPPNRGYRCAMVARQVATKAKYALWVTAAERDAIARIFTTCPEEPLPTTDTPTVAPIAPPPPPAPAPARAAPAPEPVDPPPATSPYGNCSEARAAGAAPIRRGEPGYSSKLDRDGDGVACET